MMRPSLFTFCLLSLVIVACYGSTKVELDRLSNKCCRGVCDDATMKHLRVLLDLYQKTENPDADTMETAHKVVAGWNCANNQANNEEKRANNEVVVQPSFEERSAIETRAGNFINISCPYTVTDPNAKGVTCNVYAYSTTPIKSINITAFASVSLPCSNCVYVAPNNNTFSVAFTIFVEFNGSYAYIYGYVYDYNGYYLTSSSVYSYYSPRYITISCPTMVTTDYFWCSIQVLAPLSSVNYVGVYSNPSLSCPTCYNVSLRSNANGAYGSVTFQSDLTSFSYFIYAYFRNATYSYFTSESVKVRPYDPTNTTQAVSILCPSGISDISQAISCTVIASTPDGVQYVYVSASTGDGYSLTCSGCTYYPTNATRRASFPITLYINGTSASTRSAQVNVNGYAYDPSYSIAAYNTTVVSIPLQYTLKVTSYSSPSSVMLTSTGYLSFSVSLTVNSTYGLYYTYVEYKDQAGNIFNAISYDGSSGNMFSISFSAYGVPAGRYCPSVNVHDNAYGSALFNGTCVDVKNYRVVCLAGNYISNTSSTGCRPCPQGYYSASANALLCDVCPDGYTSACNTASTTCQPCPPGTSSQDGLCQPCPVGTYSSYSGQSSCYACQGGYYMNSTGSTYCNNCPSGTYSNPGAATCSRCGAGKISNGSNGCTPCSSGSVPSSTGDYCMKCAANTFAKMGATTCTPCAKGTISAPGSFSCYAAK